MSLRTRGGGKVNRIKCYVEECSYWDNYNCRADRVEIRSNSHRVSSSQDTICHTFRPKEG
ncbi:MAG TPA: DUF1540 domain-containing protein [Moorella mulderi]|nr:DUF1540 domain-containing protein [Moorella mulderi]